MVMALEGIIRELAKGHYYKLDLIAFKNFAVSFQCQ